MFIAGSTSDVNVVGTKSVDARQVLERERVWAEQAHGGDAESGADDARSRDGPEPARIAGMLAAHQRQHGARAGARTTHTPRAHLEPPP